MNKVGITGNSKADTQKGFLFPDVCKIPAPPAPFVPLPFSNDALPLGASKTASQVKKAQSQKDSGVGGDFAGAASTVQGRVLVNHLQTLGFSKAGAALLVEGKPVQLSADKTLFNSILTKSNKPLGRRK